MIDNSRDIIKTPVITEKATIIRLDDRKYVFVVDLRAHKIQIKQAIEKIFNVKVEKINTLIVNPKKKRLGKGNHIGFTTKYKKAIVTLVKGNKIDL